MDAGASVDTGTRQASHDTAMTTTQPTPTGELAQASRSRILPFYRLLASMIDARIRCQETGNEVWQVRHAESIIRLCELLPSGSGIDCGTKLDWDESTGEKLVFTLSYHHMDENGMYDGWTDHTLTVKPSLINGVTLAISGRDRNDIKEYLHDVYDTAMTDDIKEWVVDGRSHFDYVRDAQLSTPMAH